ncbi:10949_t:CDS:2 [Ambispora leptoticha]|uniref:10949_t:CDS:1 n=1 Tax=Ambispora leptoticha TaxID=144679 RepID=A0A9N9G5H3_9GLOM|nr:10949_t:CDS:2 [Ambispora leptoticha]
MFDMYITTSYIYHKSGLDSVNNRNKLENLKSPLPSEHSQVLGVRPLDFIVCTNVTQICNVRLIDAGETLGEWWKFNITANQILDSHHKPWRNLSCDEQIRRTLADLNKSLEINPNSAFALAIRGATYRMMNRYKESLADLNKLLEINPNDAFALGNRGATYLKLLEINPNDAFTLANRGATYHMMNRYEESLTDLNKSLEINPNDAFALANRGATYHMMNRYEESLTDLNKTLEINPNDAFALANRGATYLMMNRYEESLTDLNKSLEINPNYTFALANRGAVYRIMNKTHFQI